MSEEQEPVLDPPSADDANEGGDNTAVDAGQSGGENTDLTEHENRLETHVKSEKDLEEDQGESAEEEVRVKIEPDAVGENGEDNPEENTDANANKNGEQEDDDDEDEDEDNIKVTIEDYDFKAIQKQAQPAKTAAPLVLETNQEPIDINQLNDKPWRKPGADINDYFNYGFDETTWRIYCDKQKHMKAIVDEINEPQETFKIPVVHAGPLVQANVMPYIDERLSHVVMDSRNAPLAQSVGMQQHHHQHQQHQHPHHQSGGSSRMKGVEDDVKKYDRRHNRSSERRHNSKSRERRHSKSREREREKEKDKDKDKERKRSRSRERRSKESRTRPRSRSREEERRSKRHKSSRHA